MKKKIWFLVVAVVLALGLAVPGLMGTGAQAGVPPPPYNCPTCDGTTITVDENVVIDFNFTPPTYTGEPDLLPYFSWDKSGGATADKWKAIFDVGASKLLVKSGATITVTQVPNIGNNRYAPGIEIKGTCGLEVENGGAIVVESWNKDAGNIFIHVDGDILINGTVRDEVTGTNGMPGDITIASCCGDVTVGGTGLVETLGIDPGGSDINILTCCTCRKGDIVINGLVMARAHAHGVQNEETRPHINVASFDGAVTINANSTGQPFFDEYGGGGYDIWPGLLSWVTTESLPGSVKVQALKDITVNGHGDDPTPPVRTSFAAIAVATTAATPQGGYVDVRSKEGSIIGKDRAFQVYRDGGTSLIRLWAGKDITLSRPGATAAFNPVMDVSYYGTLNKKGGTNELRAYQGGITLGNSVQVLATGNPAGNNGANNFTYCTSYSNSGTVSPAPTTSSDCSVVTPPLLFPNCAYFGITCICPPPDYITITKEVVGTAPATDWEYTSNIPGYLTFTLPAAGGSDTFNNLTTGSYTITETTKPGYTVTPSDSVTLTFTEPCGQHFDHMFTNTCTGSIKIIKVVSGAVPLTDWEFASDIPGHTAFTIDKAGDTVTFTGIPGPTADYTVTEIEKPGYAVTPINPKTLTLPACGTIEFTFTNTCTGTIKVTKVVSGAVPATDWEFTSDIPGHTAFTIDKAGDTVTFTGIPGPTADYTVTETVKPGYAVTPINPKTLTLPACGTIEFTFTNTCTGTIKVTKVVVGTAPLPGDDWVFTSDIPGHLSFTLLAAGESKTFTGIPGPTADYTVTETPKAGYTVTPSASQTKTLPACGSVEFTFTNSFECTGTIKVTKVVVGTPPLPGDDWEFASNIPGHASFTLPAAGGSVTFTGIPGPTADYTVTETPKAGYTVSPSASQTKTLPACGNIEFTFTNTSTECKWCTKSAVISQVEQNMGICCAVPDILVDLRLGITPVDPAKVGTSEPATGSLQAAVDYINAHGDINGDGYLFIGVTAQDCGTGTVGGTGACAGISGRGPYGDGTENVTITNTHTERLNIFGCSVTLHAADPTKPVITILNSVGKVTVLDIHVTGSNVAGYVVQNNADLVVVKNSRAKDTTIGYYVNDDKVEITGSPEISGNTTAGILVAGSYVTLRTNSDIINNGIGIKITGDNNETNGNEVGTNGHGNVTGILVTGKGNSLAGDNVSYNTGDGIVIAGSGTSLANGNKIEDEDAGYNGNDGIVVSGNYNTVLKNKQVKFNKGDGIEVSGNYNSLQENVTESNGGNGINVSGNNNTLKKNQSKSNTLNGIQISGNSNILDQNTGVEKNLQKGFYITGSLNKLTKNEAKNNTGYEFTIAANNNVGSSGNKANGTAFTIPLAGGNFGTP